MSVRIRFTRIGRPHDPYYRLVAIDRRQARDAKPIEILGTINPRNKQKPEALNVERIKHWISVGALASESVLFTLKKAGVWDQVKPATAGKPAAPATTAK